MSLGRRTATRECTRSEGKIWMELRSLAKFKLSMTLKGLQASGLIFFRTISESRVLVCLELPTSRRERVSRREKVKSRSSQKSLPSRYPMSKQFYVYLLPADVEALVYTLKSRLDVSLIQPSSSGPFPVKLES